MSRSKTAKAAPPYAGNISPATPKNRAQERLTRQQVRAADPELFGAVSALMFEHDPVRINGGVNTDEYDPEAGSVIPRLNNCTSVDDVTTVLYEEFQAWFGEYTAGDRRRYTNLAKDIWGVWQQRRVTPTTERMLWT